jgi:alkylhydroperoxidase/carboxymuconolactone decarboxylase family protein YurZ
MPRLEDLQKPYLELLGFMPARVRERIRLGLEIDAETTAAIEALRARLVAPAALEPKTAQLIAFGILLANLSPAAENHALAALRAGASGEELHAAAGIAFLFRGLPAINLAGEVLRAALDKHAARA